MEENKWSIIDDETSFDTAEENMQYDAQLIKTLPEYSRVERIYIWKYPSITVSYKQECPADMIHFDHAKRLTGGGIVFHSPGDIVFSIASWENDPDYYGKLSEKLEKVSRNIKLSIDHLSKASDSLILDHHIDRSRCSSYPTPFEIIVDNKKILGLTIRKFKSKCLIQGILHVADSDQSFNNYINELEKFSKLPFDIKSKLF